MSMERLRQEMNSFKDKDTGQGATSEEISETEKTLGVVLPHSYRSFLEKYGWARLGHEELYGVGSDVPAHLSLERNTVTERTQMSPALPFFLIPIMNDGAGNHYCLDTSKICGEECPVVLWDHELGAKQVTARTAKTFASWLVGLLRRLVSSTT